MTYDNILTSQISGLEPVVKVYYFHISLCVKHSKRKLCRFYQVHLNSLQ